MLLLYTGSFLSLLLLEEVPVSHCCRLQATKLAREVLHHSGFWQWLWRVAKLCKTSFLLYDCGSPNSSSPWGMGLYHLMEKITFWGWTDPLQSLGGFYPFFLYGLKFISHKEVIWYTVVLFLALLQAKGVLGFFNQNFWRGDDASWVDLKIRVTAVAWTTSHAHPHSHMSAHHCRALKSHLLQNTENIFIHQL